MLFLLDDRRIRIRTSGSPTLLTTSISSRCLPSLRFQPMYKSPGGLCSYQFFLFSFPFLLVFSSVSVNGFAFVRWFISVSKRVNMAQEKDTRTKCTCFEKLNVVSGGLVVLPEPENNKILVSGRILQKPGHGFAFKVIIRPD